MRGQVYYGLGGNYKQEVYVDPLEKRGGVYRMRMVVRDTDRDLLQHDGDMTAREVVGVLLSRCSPSRALRVSVSARGSHTWTLQWLESEDRRARFDRHYVLLHYFQTG
jgi:hypothetical protein